jgi:DNA polymerase-3 subunit alpha
LTAIKNVGLGAVESIIDERNKGGTFKSIEDLCRRCDLRGINKRVMESLIKVGAFDSLGDRGTLLHSVNSILALAQREQRLRETGQTTMFDLWGQTTSVPLPNLELEPAGVSDREKATWEKELIGVSFSEQPFTPLSGGAGVETIFCGQVDAELAGQGIVVAGRVASVRYLLTRDHRSFASALLEDVSGQIEVMVWPKIYEDTKELWQEGNILLVEGKVRLRDDRLQLNCDSVRYYQTEVTRGDEVSAVESDKAPPFVKEIPSEIPPTRYHRLVVSINQTSDEVGDIASLHKVIDILKEFPGKDEVSLCVNSGGKVVNLTLSALTANYCSDLHQKLVELVGEDLLRVETQA